ncbi:dTMP kinase [Haloarcula sp. JP-L23]|uniref:dTMP kinase n=1 Tax=Haloarcula sp. JP-L23 TaxID=2716717 RepID=UPI00140F3CDF|nr:dTMP kinase [Haloarcula sp. JP-L23]
MLVTLEGLDGSGKTTVWERLRAGDAVPEDATFTREPTDSWYGEAVQRSIDDDDADSLAELFLYTADHAAHLADTIRPALADGRLVVSDRYSDSRYAYQGATLSGTNHFEDPLDYVREVHAPWTRPPDLTVYLDLDPETAARRSGATNKFETADYLADVRENYERLIEDDPERFVRVDATADPETVSDRVRGAILDRL